MLDKPKMYIIGSLSQMDDILKMKELHKDLYTVITVKKEKQNISFENIVRDCFKKITECNRLLVVTKPDSSLGEGVTYEVEFARFLGKNISFYTPKRKE